MSINMAFFDRALTGRRRTPGWVALFVAIIVFLAGGLAGAIIFMPLTLPMETHLQEYGTLPAETQTFAVANVAIMLAGYTVVIIALAWLWLRLWEGRKLISLGLEPSRFGRALRGSAFGLIAVACWAALLVFSGTTSAEATITAGQFPLVALIAACLILPAAWMVQAVSEEIVFRGLAFQAIGRKYGLIAGALVTSVLFTLLHAANGVANIWYYAGICMMGVFFCLYAVAEDSLWGPAGFHAAWNFAQLHLFGFRATTEDVVPNVLMLQLEAAPRLMEIPATQNEISLTALPIVLLLVAIAFIAVLRKTRTR